MGGERSPKEWIARRRGASEPRTELWSMSAFQVNVDSVLAELQELLDGRWSAPLRKTGIEFTTQLVRGDPATELLRAAKRVRASMLVLGSRSHTNLADLIVGGTVHKVINRSTIPVMLVPATPAANKRAATRVRATVRSPK
jgi:nucleotide-binding universal stress UspA family protein